MLNSNTSKHCNRCLTQNPLLRLKTWHFEVGKATLRLMTCMANGWVIFAWIWSSNVSRRIAQFKFAQFWEIEQMTYNLPCDRQWQMANFGSMVLLAQVELWNALVLFKESLYDTINVWSPLIFKLCGTCCKILLNIVPKIWQQGRFF